MSKNLNSLYFSNIHFFLNNFSIAINNSTIEQVEYFHFLGVPLDQNITWNPHVDEVSIQISCVTGFLRKLQHYFPKHILITIVQLAYSISSNVWSSSMGFPKYAC